MMLGLCSLHSQRLVETIVQDPAPERVLYLPIIDEDLWTQGTCDPGKYSPLVFLQNQPIGSYN
jgi:hypothetical protein